MLTCGIPSLTFAQTAEAPPPASETATGGRFWLPIAAALGGGFVIAGASLGISRIGSSAVECMARQPEAAGNIQTAMIVSAALIEGVTFFALIVLLIALFRL